MFSFGKDKKYMLQSKQSNQFDILCLTHALLVVSGFHCECFFQIPSSFFRKKLKEDENEEKTIDGLQKKSKSERKNRLFLINERPVKTG